MGQTAKALAGVAVGASAAAPFVAGIGLVGAAWLIGRYVAHPAGPGGWAMRAARWFYVLGHELTHALAAWSTGGKVFGIKVASDGGHADVSESGAFVALAPYCLPFHALLVVAGYRALLWFRPGLQVEALFLMLIGGALAFHALMTFEALADAKQPDLDVAGGVVFSLALIACVNGVVVLALLKVLFPESVVFAGSVRAAGSTAWWFWAKAWGAVTEVARRFLGARAVA